MANHKNIKPSLSEDTSYDMLAWLPNEIIFNMLSRFSVKDLLRLSLVSKSWLSLISSRDFVETHLSVSTNDPHFTHHHLLDYDESHGILSSLSLYSLLREHVTEATQLDHPAKELVYIVVGYCHGLVCLVTFAIDDVYLLLWNPSTRKSRTLPKLAMINDDYENAVYGFCYDELNDDLKVFVDFFGGPDCKNNVSVYSSKSDSWRMIGEFPFRGTVDCKQGVFANNAIHWVFKRPSMQFTYHVQKIIVSLDISTETYQEVLQPKSAQDACQWTLATFDKSLSLFCKFSTCADLWVMKEFGAEEPWTKLLTIPYTDGLVWYSFLEPVSGISLINGDVIVNFRSGIKLYNSKDNTFKDLFHGSGHRYFSIVDTYVESLVSPHFCSLSRGSN